MTTPQNILQNMEYKIGTLIKKFEGGDEDNIFEDVKNIYICVKQIHDDLEVLKNTVNLIIKSLSKPNG